jgi:HEAT repeat protein
MTFFTKRQSIEAFVASIFMVVVVYGFQLPHTQQHNPATNEKKAEELLNDKRYPFEDLLAAKPDAVANAKQIFALTADARLKQRLASILLSVGVKDPLYLDYLTSAAKQALENDMPWPTLYDKEGQIVPKVINPAFLKWCKERGLDPRDTFEAAYYEIPIPWYYLAGSGDPRGYTLLITGLHSANPMIVAWSATGLAKLQDPAAIEEIIAAYHRAPAETRVEIAESLLYFPDSRAQAAAEEFIRDKELLARRRQKIKEKGTKMLFGY